MRSLLLRHYLRFLWLIPLIGLTAISQAAPSIGTTSFNSPASGGFTNVTVGPSPKTVTYLGYIFTVQTTGNAAITHASSRVNLVASSGTLNYYRFESDDGSEFKLNNINFRVSIAGFVTTWTMTGYRNNVAVPGATSTLNVTATATDFSFDVSSIAAFNYIDRFEMTASVTTGTLQLNSITIAAGVPPATAPLVSSPTSTGVTHAAATLGGNVTSDGGATITARGVVVSPTATNSNPQIGGTGVTNVTGTGTTGIFSVSATGLTPSTGYTYKAYATNSVGTTYSSTGTFTTSAPPDTTPPTISIGAPSVSLTTGGPVSYTVTYSDANFSSSTLANANVTLNSTGTASGSVNVTGSGTTRTVTISSITGDGTLGISIAAGTASDTAGNLAPAAGPSTTFAVDNTAPGISIGAPSASTTAGGPVSYTVTYSGQNSITLNSSNVTVNSTGTAGAGTVNVTGSGSTRTVELSSISGDGTLGISISAGTASDTAGNGASAAGPSTTFTVDNTAPGISIGAPSASTVAGGPVSYTVTYSGQNSITLSSSNVTVNSTGTASAGTVNVTGSGSTRTVELSSISGDGTLGISIAAGTASDTAGNTAAAAGPSGTFTVDNTAPSISIGAPSASLTKSGPVSYTITYSGQNSITLSSSNVTVNSTGTASAGTVNVTGSGSTRTVELSSITGDGTLGISIASGTASDTAGNTAAAAGPSGTFTVDNTAPVITSALTDSGTYRVSYSYSITASGAPATYGATGLPAGLGVDSGTGAISGTPTAAGSFSVSLTATDAAGNVGNATLNLSIAQVSLSITGLSANNKPYDGSTSATLIGTAALSGVNVADTSNVSLSGTASGAFGTATVGTSKTVTVSGLSLTGSAAANYVLSPLSLTADITAVQLTVTADNKSRPYGSANPTLTATITGFVGGENSSVVSGSAALSTLADSSSAPGDYTITAAIGSLSATNYTFAFANGTLTVTLLTFEDWQEENFTPSELLDTNISGPAGDPDVDNVSNLYEYAFGTDPNNFASGPSGLQYSGTLAGGVTVVDEGQPITVVEVISGTTVTRVLFLRRKPAYTSDLTYTPQFSANGTAWVNGAVAPTILADDGLYELVSVPYPLTTSGKKTRFFRVTVDLDL